jgi:hypothetical protein
LLGQMIGGAKVFLGGGQEANGIELADKVQDSADSALERSFLSFREADHANWGQVVNPRPSWRCGRAFAGGLPRRPHQAPRLPSCARLHRRRQEGQRTSATTSRAAPFGWPQDAIDGALLVMLVAGNLRATVNGQPVQATLPQNQVGVASFYVDVPPLNVQQRLDLKALFQKVRHHHPERQGIGSRGQA